MCPRSCQWRAQNENVGVKLLTLIDSRTLEASESLGTLKTQR
jgi:hypothetical protein